MAIAFQTSATGGATTATSVTVNKPTGTAVGDLLVASINTYDDETVNISAAPSGWTLLTSVIQGSGVNSIRHWIYWRIADGSEGASFQWTFSASIYSNGAVARYSGTHQTNPISVYSTNNGSSTTRTGTGITTSYDNCVLVMSSIGFNSAPASPPSGMTTQITYDTVNKWYDENITTAGATGNRSTSTTSDPWTAIMFALRPALTRTLMASVVNENNTGGTSQVTSSFTPTDNSLLVAIGMGMTDSPNGGSSPVNSISGGGLSWTKVHSYIRQNTFYSNSSLDWWQFIDIWIAQVTTGASMTVTLTTPTTCDGRTLAVYEYIGHNKTIPTGAVASDVKINSTGSFTITLNAALPSSSDVLAACVQNNWVDTNPIVAGTGWTELTLYNNLAGTGETCTQIQSRTGSTSTSVLWNTVDVDNDGSMNAIAAAIEIIAAGIQIRQIKTTSAGTGAGYFTDTANGALSFTDSTLTGSAIIAIASGWGGSANGSFLDNKGNSYSIGINERSSEDKFFVHYSTNITGGSSHQVTFNNTTGMFGVMTLLEVSGLAPSPLDATGSTRTATSSPSHTTATLAQSDELAIAVISDVNDGISTTPTSPWVDLFVRNDFGNDTNHSASYRIVNGSNSAITASWTTGGSGNSTRGIVTFMMELPEPPIGITATLTESDDTELMVSETSGLLIPRLVGQVDHPYAELSVIQGSTAEYLAGVSIQDVFPGSILLAIYAEIDADVGSRDPFIKTMNTVGSVTDTNFVWKPLIKAQSNMTDRLRAWYCVVPSNYSPAQGSIMTAYVYDPQGTQFYSWGALQVIEIKRAKTSAPILSVGSAKVTSPATTYVSSWTPTTPTPHSPRSFRFATVYAYSSPAGADKRLTINSQTDADNPGGAFAAITRTDAVNSWGLLTNMEWGSSQTTAGWDFSSSNSGAYDINLVAIFIEVFGSR